MRKPKDGRHSPVFFFKRIQKQNKAYFEKADLATASRFFKEDFFF